MLRQRFTGPEAAATARMPQHPAHTLAIRSSSRFTVGATQVCTPCSQRGQGRAGRGQWNCADAGWLRPYTVALHHGLPEHSSQHPAPPHSMPAPPPSGYRARPADSHAGAQQANRAHLARRGVVARGGACWMVRMKGRGQGGGRERSNRQGESGVGHRLEAAATRCASTLELPRAPNTAERRLTTPQEACKYCNWTQGLACAAHSPAAAAQLSITRIVSARMPAAWRQARTASLGPPAAG